MSKFKFKIPGKAAVTMSSVPMLYPLRDTVKNMNVLAQVPDRLDRGRELFLLALAEMFRREIQNRAPEIDIGGDEVDYSKELRIAIVDGTEDTEAVAVYFECAKTTLTEQRMGNTALFFKSKTGSPQWVSVLSRFNPWPASMVPLKVKEEDAKIIARKIRPDEAQALGRRLYARRKEIETLLVRSGASNPKVVQNDLALGVVIREDVGYNVLRKEFGFDGEKQESHWRPVLRAIKDMMPFLIQRFERYLLTGRENVFELPSEVYRLSAGRMKETEPFQKELAPFLPTGG